MNSFTMFYGGVIMDTSLRTLALSQMIFKAVLAFPTSVNQMEKNNNYGWNVLLVLQCLLDSLSVSMPFEVTHPKLKFSFSVT